jgi:hypothetical protein
MAKAKQVTNKKLVESGWNTNDLSSEKRTELANEALTAFIEEAKTKFSLAIDIELVFNKKGIVPRLVWVDIKPKKDGEQKES